ncbi:hypothetical protein EVAR_53600_1 [Eumeta japonica]|uniref:Uncharacterized protein n=1 Tax=Eumeta variegata TaxID=151549 RepID=A0A4C1X2D3_EUMVA|nr:hypothetical protein EVAR_53600_1 [Eumeta japonica]
MEENATTFSPGSHRDSLLVSDFIPARILLPAKPKIRLTQSHVQEYFPGTENELFIRVPVVASVPLWDSALKRYIVLAISTLVEMKLSCVRWRKFDYALNIEVCVRARACVCVCVCVCVPVYLHAYARCMLTRVCVAVLDSHTGLYGRNIELKLQRGAMMLYDLCHTKLDCAALISTLCYRVSHRAQQREDRPHQVLAIDRCQLTSYCSRRRLGDAPPRRHNARSHTIIASSVGSFKKNIFNTLNRVFVVDLLFAMFHGFLVWAVWPAVAVAFTCAHPICTDRMRTGKRNRHRRPDSPDPNPKSKRDDISINQLT